MPAPRGDETGRANHVLMGGCAPAEEAPAPLNAACRPRLAPTVDGPPASLVATATETPTDPRAQQYSTPSAGTDGLLAVSRSHAGYQLLLDRFEYRARDGHDGYAWEGEAWYGGDYDRLWFKTEGEGGFGESLESAEVQALWSHALDPWFNLQTGVRYDIRPEPDRAHLAVGVQGLAPYWFEVDIATFLSDRGDLTARLEAEYDQRITNRLILQPSVEIELSAQDIPSIDIGAGLSSVEAGLRLRYEFVPEFAPYIGVQYERGFGDTADFARAEGEDVGGWAFVAGLRAWF